MATGGTALERDHLRYTPGDGYVYVWQHGQQWIKVYRIIRADPRMEVETPDVIEVPTSRTGEQLAMAVDRWRLARE